MFEQILKDFKIGQAIRANDYSTLALAYIGDSVYELYVRTYIMKDLNTHANKLHTITVGMVNAKAQAETFRKIEGELTTTELAVYKRGRNAPSHVPKNAELSDYKAATGFETLIGHLYINGDTERLIELLNKCMM